jgi:MipA family protein
MPKIGCLFAQVAAVLAKPKILCTTLCAFIAISSNATLPSEAKTSQKPLIELGIGAGGGMIEDYPAADQSQLHYLVLPAARYRGEIFRADEQDGYRAELIKDYHYELNLSFGGSFPANSEKNRARAGMPNLDWTAEVGPRFNYYFMRDHENRLRIGLPLRAVFTTNFQYLKGIGATCAPEVEYQRSQVLCSTCILSSSLTTSFVSQETARFFYEVEAAYETADRPRFTAHQGYLGSDLTEVLIINWDRSVLYLGFTYSNRSGSANHESPLYKRDLNWNVFAAFSWYFAESLQRELPESHSY